MAIESERSSPAASSPSSAHAVCEGVLAPMPRVFGIVVAAARLAPAAIGVLHHANPLGGLLHLRLVVIEADCIKSAQHQERAVDVVHAPAAEPASVRLLLAEG